MFFLVNLHPSSAGLLGTYSYGEEPLAFCLFVVLKSQNNGQF